MYTDLVRKAVSRVQVRQVYTYIFEDLWRCSPLQPSFTCYSSQIWTVRWNWTRSGAQTEPLQLMCVWCQEALFLKHPSSLSTTLKMPVAQGRNSWVVTWTTARILSLSTWLWALTLISPWLVMPMKECTLCPWPKQLMGLGGTSSHRSQCSCRPRRMGQTTTCTSAWKAMSTCTREVSAWAQLEGGRGGTWYHSWQTRGLSTVLFKEPHSYSSIKQAQTLMEVF